MKPHLHDLATSNNLLGFAVTKCLAHRFDSGSQFGERREPTQRGRVLTLTGARPFSEEEGNSPMIFRFSALALLATIASGSAVCGPAEASTFKVVKPLFLALPAKPAPQRPFVPGGPLVQWNGSFVDHLGQTINYTMVGTDPSKTNVVTTIPVAIIPIKMVYGGLNGKTTFDPMTTVSQNGKSVVHDLIVSPLLNGRATFIQGGTNVGTTQYIDAFQRANFWSFVQKNQKYHVILGKPKLLPEIGIRVPPGVGLVEANPFGGTTPIGTMEVDVFDQHIQAYLNNTHTVTPNTLPLFVTSNIYLTEGSAVEVCCIGGYHSAIGSQPNGQTYAYATYVTEKGVFSQDVSAWSHEIGEWMDDPFVDNSVNCLDNTSMEDGDPLENNPNSGAFPYMVNGGTYNLQSLVFLGYFGAPPSTSLHSWLSFQNDEHNVCPGQ
jgi:hypothetical protein